MCSGSRTYCWAFFRSLPSLMPKIDTMLGGDWLYGLCVTRYGALVALVGQSIPKSFEVVAQAAGCGIAQVSVAGC